MKSFMHLFEYYPSNKHLNSFTWSCVICFIKKVVGFVLGVSFIAIYCLFFPVTQRTGWTFINGFHDFLAGRIFRMNPRLFFGFEYRRVVLYTIAGILLVGHQSADIDWIQRVFIWEMAGFFDKL